MPSDIEDESHARKFKFSISTLLRCVLVLALVAAGYEFRDLLFSSRVRQQVFRPSVKIELDLERRDAVVEAFKHAWNAYERDAMGYDEYHPLSHKGSNIADTPNKASPPDGIGYTVVDALDTIHLMNLTGEYKRARHWVKKKLTFEDKDGVYSTFETTIRVLGGLLSMHNLTGDALYLSKSIDLGDRLLSAFDTPTGMPLPSVNLAKKEGVPDQWSPQTVSTAEVTTLQLEFNELSRISGKTRFKEASDKAMKVVRDAVEREATEPWFGLVPIFMNVNTGEFTHSDIRLGSRGDSYYEYLLKQYLQSSKTQPEFGKMYDQSMTALHTHLVSKSKPRGITYIAELVPNRKGGYDISPKQDHLVCFLAGSLMLGSSPGERDWVTGEKLLETCVDTYLSSRTGLSPEIAMFREEDDEVAATEQRDWYIKNWRNNTASQTYDARYMLRPETVESLFLAYRLTGEERYREYAWKIFESIQRWCRVPDGGYATILDVDGREARWDDKQETFFLSETLKYLYLIFEGPEVIPLDQYVFNTEAHPLPIY